MMFLSKMECCFKLTVYLLLIFIFNHCKSEAACEETVLITEEGSSIVSPDYPGIYPHNVECQWMVQAPSTTKRVALTTIHFELEYSFTYGCVYDSVQIYDGSTTDNRIGIFCGSKEDGYGTVPGEIHSSRKDILIVFKSDGTTTFTGFNFTVQFIYSSEEIRNAINICYWKTPIQDSTETLIELFLNGQNNSSSQVCGNLDVYLDCILALVYDGAALDLFDVAVRQILEVTLSDMDLSGYSVLCDYTISINITQGECAGLNEILEASKLLKNQIINETVGICSTLDMMVESLDSLKTSSNCMLVPHLITGSMEGRVLEAIAGFHNCLVSGYTCNMDCETCAVFESYKSCIYTSVDTSIPASGITIKDMFRAAFSKLYLSVLYFETGAWGWYPGGHYTFWIDNRETVCRSFNGTDVSEITNCLITSQQQANCPSDASYDWFEESWYSDIWNSDDFYDYTGDYYYDWYMNTQQSKRQRNGISRAGRSRRIKREIAGTIPESVTTSLLEAMCRSECDGSLIYFEDISWCTFKLLELSQLPVSVEEQACIYRQCLEDSTHGCVGLADGLIPDKFKEPQLQCDNYTNSGNIWSFYGDMDNGFDYWFNQFFDSYDIYADLIIIGRLSRILPNPVTPWLASAVSLSYTYLFKIL